MSLPSLSKIVTVTIAGRIRIFGRLPLEGLSKVAVNVSASSRTSSSVMVTLTHCRLVLLPNPSRDWFIGWKSCRSEETKKCLCYCYHTKADECSWPAVPACVFTVRLNCWIRALDSQLILTQILPFPALSETSKDVFSKPTTNSVYLWYCDY